MKRIARLAPVFFLGALFLYAGADKVAHYSRFVNALSTYKIVATSAAPYIAIPVILSEFAVGLGLLIASYRRIAATASVALLSLFTVALVVNYFYKPGSICGCWFTLTLGTSTGAHILQNLILVALALTVWWEERLRGGRSGSSRTLAVAS